MAWLIHYITTDDDIITERRDEQLPREEISTFVGGHPEHVWVWPNKQRHSMFVNEDGQRLDLPLNIYATNLYHECTKYKRGLKGDGRHDEPHVRSIEDLIYLEPLDDLPWIHGPAIFYEEDNDG